MRINPKRHSLRIRRKSLLPRGQISPKVSPCSGVSVVLDSNRKHSSVSHFVRALLLIDIFSFTSPLFSPLWILPLFKKKKESFTPDILVADGRLVSVPPPSSQLDARDKLWCVHSALLQCHILMERAIAKEEAELGGGKRADYETQRKMVKDRLSLLLINTGELLRAVDGTAALQTPSVDGLEVNSPTALFELKVWVYRIFREVDYWTRTAVSVLQALPSASTKERVMTTRVRSVRSTR